MKGRKAGQRVEVGKGKLCAKRREKKERERERERERKREGRGECIMLIDSHIISQL